MSPRDLIETSAGPVTVLHRLALGVLARDGITSRGAADGLRVGWEAAPPLLPPHHPGWWPCIDLEQVGGGRFRLRATESRPAIVVMRLHDPARRYVSRRLEVTLWPHAALVDPDPAHHVAVAARTLPVWLPPGAAYSLPRGATAVRGRVVRDGTPVHWARVVGVGPGNAVLGRARTDDRGEFLLILGETNQNPVQSTVGVDLRVHGPVAQPATGTVTDPLADLPAEPIARPANPPVPSDLDNASLRGELILPGSVGNAAPAVHLNVPVGSELSLTADVPFAPQP
ncbi:hypothetical protein EV649_5067 [Kribbella sp. VKM Ac-2569]|uniref:hypothetical protein n=1 Tax=Kribbella sp. VKM Ac-2569 TaxID=2512220 RepID=UPI00102CF98F|nr:hypothetical protein [Kribbella sp. VKM Ac-2569]RZT17520.1 hypothetical protein EV649_5067 [Kribbella sp. VKM Ac-2569]